jgi:hypothetical protein
MAGPDARPIRKGKLRQPTEFGYVFQLTEVCENTRRGARGLIIPAATQPGSPNEPDLLPTTAAELRRLGLKPREIATVGSSPTAFTCSSPIRSESSSTDATRPAPNAPTAAWPSSGSAAKAASATSNAATDSNDHASKATTARVPGPRGRSSPTTSTPSPSAPADSISTATGHPPRSRFAPRPRPPSAAVFVLNASRLSGASS